VRLRHAIYTLQRQESATTATEYAVMLALIIVVCIGSLTLYGQSLSGSVFGTINALFGP